MPIIHHIINREKKPLQCSMSTNSCFQRASNEVHLVFDLIWSVLKLAFIYGDSLNYLIELKIKWKVLPINDWWDCIKLACICNVNASIYAHGARDVTSISLCSWWFQSNLLEFRFISLFFTIETVFVILYSLSNQGFWRKPINTDVRAMRS